MAKTPLLHCLQKQYRLAQSIWKAQTSEPNENLPTDESRRTFLAHAGMLTAGALASPVLASRAKKHRRIAIVGGGIAGLSCALTLKDHGIAATVYEGSGRLGGRMFSDTGTWEAGQVSEWCGELIDTGHKTIRKLAQRFGLELDNLASAQPQGSEDTFYFNGQYYPYSQFQLDIKPVMDAVAADLKAADYPTTFSKHTKAGKVLDAMSIRDWIQSRVPGGMNSTLGALIDTAYAIEYGADTTDQSALNLIYLLGYQPESKETFLFGESDEVFHIRGGNELLPKAIAREIGMDKIVTDRRMSSLQKLNSGAYRLTFTLASGQKESVEADCVVLAIPFAVLRELDILEAGFDERKLRAIQELGRGLSGKTQLQFHSRIWNGSGTWPGVSSGSSYSDTGYQSGWEVTRAQAGSQGILNFFSGGSNTLSQKTVQSSQPFTSNGHALSQQDAEAALKTGEPVFPGLTDKWNGRYTQSIPHLSPLFRASYAYYRVGQYTDFGGYEGVKQGGVFFCGEHTSPDFQGFMEGGAAEGIRAAKEVLKA